LKSIQAKSQKFVGFTDTDATGTGGGRFASCRAFGGKNLDVRLDSYQLGRSGQVFNTMKSSYQESIQHGDKWTGVLLSVLSDGQFRFRFYYEQTPLLADDDDALERILSEGMSDFAHS
jgi:hypothetical protein